MGRLHAKRVRKVRRPDYPTKREVEAVPALLAAHVPSAWLSREDLAKALGVFLAANSAGCRTETASTATSRDAKTGPPAAAIVAPIFVHGDGRGAVGCVVLNPPDFLAEEEALQLVNEQLAKHGVKLAQRNVTLPDLLIPKRVLGDIRSYIEKGQAPVASDDYTHAEPLTVDSYDPGSGIAIEFISTDDLDTFGELYWSSVQSYDCLEGAQWLADRVRTSGNKVYWGTFYDPMPRLVMRDWIAEAEGQLTSPFAQFGRSAPDMKLAAQRMLREQVKDFVDWLKAQGAI